MKKSLKALLAAVLVAALLAGSVTAFAEDGAEPTPEATEEIGDPTPQEPEPTAEPEPSPDPEPSPEPESYAGHASLTSNFYVGSYDCVYPEQTGAFGIEFSCEAGLGRVSGQVSAAGATYTGGSPESFSLDAGGATEFVVWFNYTVTAAPGETVTFSAVNLSATTPDGKPIVFEATPYPMGYSVGDLERYPTADKSALEAAVNKAKALNEEDYTSSSWESLSPILATATGWVLPDPAVDQFNVNVCLHDLENAMESLVLYVDASAQVEALRAALARLEAMDQSAMTPEGKQHFADVKARAERELAYPRPDAYTLEYYAEEINSLIDAIAAGTFQAPDKSALAALVEKAKALKEEDYTSYSWSIPYMIEWAEEVLADPYADQWDVNGAYTSLNDAIDRLVPYEPVDQALLDQLQEAIDRAQAVKKGDYSDNVVWQLWAAAGNASFESWQERPDKAALEEWLRILNSLLDGKGIPTDYSALEAIVAKAESLNPGDYTDESWYNLINSISGGQWILRNKDVIVYLQSNVDEATTLITAAVNALVKQDPGAVDPGKDEVPKTGDPLMQLLRARTHR